MPPLLKTRKKKNPDESKSVNESNQSLTVEPPTSRPASKGRASKVLTSRQSKDKDASPPREASPEVPKRSSVQRKVLKEIETKSPAKVTKKRTSKRDSSPEEPLPLPPKPASKKRVSKRDSSPEEPLPPPTKPVSKKRVSKRDSSPEESLPLHTKAASMKRDSKRDSTPEEGPPVNQASKKRTSRRDSSPEVIPPSKTKKRGVDRDWDVSPTLSPPAKRAKKPLPSRQNDSSSDDDCIVDVESDEQPKTKQPNASKTTAPGLKRKNTSNSTKGTASLLDDDGDDSDEFFVESPRTQEPPKRRVEIPATESASSSVSNSNFTDTRMTETSFDPNDPDWLKFTQSVKVSPENAHLRLSADLVSTQNRAAILGKLIYRSISEAENPETKEMSEKYGLTIIRAVLHSSLENDNKSGAIADIVNMLFTELRHFHTSVLYSISEHSLEYMKTDRQGPLPPRWIEVFGKIVTELISRGDIKHETDLMDGKSYREYIVTEMLGSRVRWTNDNTASLVAIFRQIPGLDDNELRGILSRVKSGLMQLKPSAVPPIIYQLILLAGRRHPTMLLDICSGYFAHVDFSKNDSLEVKQKRNALGTVVYHFLEASRHCDALIKAVIKVVKASFYDFEQVVTPFILSVVLGLTTFDYAKALIIDPLRTSIMKFFQTLHLSESSYWFRHKVAPSGKDTVTECFKAVLETSKSKTSERSEENNDIPLMTRSSELEFMYAGLRELGIGLLNADAFQNKFPNTLERCQALGKYLICSIVKSDPEQMPLMIKSLLQLQLSSNSKSSVQMECLAACLEMRTRQMISPTMIGKACEIIRHLSLMNSESAAMIVKALSSALNLSYILLDQLMINLRKNIWTSVDARRTVAKIMIILLSNSRVVGEVPFSQYSESQRFTSSSQNNVQSTANGSLPDNQPLCMEILTLAKRCFSQQCEIKEELYLGYHSVVRKNPGLCELICSQLYNHTNQYFEEVTENTENDPDPSHLLFSKLLELPSKVTYGVIATPKEELGFLVQCISFVVHKSHRAFHELDEGPPAAVNKLEHLLQRCIDIVLKMTQNDIETASADIVCNAGGARPMDTSHYVGTMLAIQVMQAIEALIEFLNLENKRGKERLVKKLFDKHNTIAEILKKEKERPGNKKGKGENKGKASQKGGKKDVTIEDSMADDASETSENPGAVVKFKKPEGPKKLVYFHILNLESALDMLRKLQKTDVDKGVLKSVCNEEFEKFLLSVVKQKLSCLKKKESLHERNRPLEKIVETLADIAGCIWNGLLTADHTENEEEDSVDPAASIDMIEVRLETVAEIVSFLCTSHPSCGHHLLKGFCDEQESLNYNAAFPRFFKSWITVYEWMPDIHDGDKTVLQSLFDILFAVSKPLTPDSSGSERDGGQNRAGDVLNWLWNYMASSTGKNKREQAEFLLADSVVSCWLAYYSKSKDFLEQPGKSSHDLLSLASGVRQCMGVWEEVETQIFAQNAEIKMWIINEDTASTIFCLILNHIEIILDHINVVLAKVKCNPNEEQQNLNNVGLLRGCCFNKMEEILQVCSHLVGSAFPSGPCCETILKVIPQIFTVMTGFGEYFFDLIKSRKQYSLKGFSKPVTTIGKSFQPLVEGMISHVSRVNTAFMEEINQRQQAGSKKPKAAQRVPQAVKNLLAMEKKRIPNLVYTIEKYDQIIISLSKKSDKNQLLVGMKLSNARDFKINTSKLLEIINSRSTGNVSTIAEDDTNAGNISTVSKPRVRNRKRKTSETTTVEEGEEEAED